MAYRWPVTFVKTPFISNCNVVILLNFIEIVFTNKEVSNHQIYQQFYSLDLGQSSDRQLKKSKKQTVGTAVPSGESVFHFPVCAGYSVLWTALPFPFTFTGLAFLLIEIFCVCHLPHPTRLFWGCRTFQILYWFFFHWVEIIVSNNKDSLVQKKKARCLQTHTPSVDTAPLGQLLL